MMQVSASSQSQMYRTERSQGPGERVIVARVSATQQASVLEAIANFCDASCLCCVTDIEAAQRAETRQIEAIIWELSRWLPGPNALPESVLRASLKTPLVLRTDLNERALEQMVRLSRTPVDWRLSLIERDDLASEIVALLSGRTGAAYESAISAVVSRVPPSLQRLLLSILIIGQRRTTVIEFAKLSGRDIRSVNALLRQHEALPLRALLARSLLMYLTWRVSVDHIPPKQAAAMAGYSGSGGTAAVGEMLFRHAGMRWRNIMRQGAFDYMLSRFLAAVNCEVSVAPTSDVDDDCRDIVEGCMMFSPES